MATLSLLGRDRERHEFYDFTVEVWRSPESLRRYFVLVGRESGLFMSLTVMLYPVFDDCQILEVYDNSLEVCDMLNYFLQLKNDDYSESEALQLVGALYPEHFKYLTEFGYESPPEEGGAVDVE